MPPDPVVDPIAATVAAYDADADAYAAGTAGSTSSDPALDAFAARLAPGATVLEIGSGPGHDARRLEGHGLVVRRTDVSTGFVERLRALGHAADVLDPLTDDLGGPYAAVWAAASLLHVRRSDLAVVLGRLAGAVGPGGLLHASLKEGDGDRWSAYGHVRSPRHFTYWREPALRATLGDAGWSVLKCRREHGERDDWLVVLAKRGVS